jgi:hypothetical protein
MRSDVKQNRAADRYLQRLNMRLQQRRGIGGGPCHCLSSLSPSCTTNVWFGLIGAALGSSAGKLDQQASGDMRDAYPAKTLGLQLEFVLKNRAYLARHRRFYSTATGLCHRKRLVANRLRHEAINRIAFRAGPWRVYL